MNTMTILSFYRRYQYYCMSSSGDGDRSLDWLWCKPKGKCNVFKKYLISHDKNGVLNNLVVFLTLLYTQCTLKSSSSVNVFNFYFVGLIYLIQFYLTDVWFVKTSIYWLFCSLNLWSSLQKKSKLCIENSHYS